MCNYISSEIMKIGERIKPMLKNYSAAFFAIILMASAAGCNGNVFQNLPGKEDLNLLLMMASQGSGEVGITSITSSSANDLYGIGDAINITVNFKKSVTLSGGTLEITLNTGAIITVSAAGYPSRILTGTYVVAAGEESTDLDATAINLTGGTLRDAKGNDVNLLMPSTTLADRKNILVDGIAPDNQDDVFTPSVSKQGTDTVAIDSSGDAANQVWFAPVGTTVFTAGPTMTMAANGASTTIGAPDTEGTYYIYIIDAAGNVSLPSAATLTVDNTAPSVAITSPNGGADFTTGTASQTISGSCSADSSVTISTDTGSVNDGDCSDGDWSLSALALPDGANTITVTATDAANNTANDAITISVDTSLRSIAITYNMGGDTTSPFKAGSIIITATFDVTPLDTPQIAIDQAGTNDLAATDMSGSGTTWTYTYTINPAGGGNADGPATITLSNIVPTGGGIFATPSNATFTIDTTVVAPTIPDLAEANDTGPSDSDNITSDTDDITFSGTAEPNATIQLYNGVTPLGSSVTANGAGNWSVTIASMPAGAYTMNATQTDTAGNTSAASGNLSLTIDTSVSAPSAPDLDAGDDTGTSTSDNITSTTDDLTFTGTAEPNATVQLYNGAAPIGSPVTANGSGNWTIDLDLLAGSYSINAIQTDPAGNTSAASGNLLLTIDTAANAPAVPDLDDGDDTGSSSSDNITSTIDDLTFSGTAENNAAIEIFDSATSLGTTAANGSGVWTINLDLAAGTYSINVKQTDTAGNTSAASGNLPLTIDTTKPDVTIGIPAPLYVNSSGTADYSVTYNNADTINLTAVSVILNTTGGATCDKAVINGTSPSPTVRLSNCTGNGTVDIQIAAGTSSDLAGNTDDGDSTSTAINVDNALPVISSVAPAGGASVNNTLVSYTLSEICSSGSITWTHAGGTADGASPHAQALAGSELNAGAHNNIIITNNPTLVDGAVYDITFNAIDRAGNTATEILSAGVTYSDAPLTAISAETMDTDNDGKIDAYRVAFNKSVNDSTFPGYAANSEGTATSHWLVAGYTDVRLIHGTAVTFAADTANDSVIYLRFDESLTVCSAADQSGCDTGSKPDLTTTATPGLQDLFTNALAQIESSTVTESDGAKPLLITARSLNSTSTDVIFSEAMEETTSETAAYYGIDNGITVSAAVRDDGNNKVVHLTTSAQTGGTTYTLTVDTSVKDMANISLDPSANTVTFDGNVKPIVVSIDTVNATTLTITFNETVTAASAECGNITACGAIYGNTSLPVKTAVSTGGAGVNSATFTLTVNPMAEGQSYTTSVLENTVTSVASGLKMGNVNNSATFTGDGKPGAYISTDTATECPTPSNLPPSSAAQTRVIVQYDQAVTAMALTTTNYKIVLCLANAPCDNGTGDPNNAGANAVTDMGGNKYAVDFTDPFDSDPSEYQLNISNVQDASGNVVEAPTNLGFVCGNDLTPPSLIRAIVVTANASTTQVLLTFSESVDQVTANTASSYKYDSEAYGTDVYSAARQSNYAQVLVTFAPGLDPGGHQIRVQNVKDLAPTANTILDNGLNNVQPIIVTAPGSLGDGDVFTDPFNDGTRAALIVRYDGKLYLGTDAGAAKLFEVDYGLTTSQLILIDADGTPGAPVEDFYGYTTLYSDSGTQNPDTTLKGVDTLYAACVGGTSTPSMTGDECEAAGGTESLFIGALNISGLYKSFWHTTDVSTLTTTFTFDEEQNPDSGGAYAFRSTVFVVFKDQLWNHFGAEAGGGGRGGRICMKDTGCDDGTVYLNTATGGFPNVSSIARIGQSGSPIRNGSLIALLGGGNDHDNYLNAVNLLYEHDNDGSGSNNESQLYMANGGALMSGTLGQARLVGTYSDGGIVRTQLTYSTRSSLPVNCTGTGCPTYWEDMTPDGNNDWNSFVSIPYPENSAITGSANCSSSQIEMDCTEPFNLFTPSMKAVPYMRTAPNGDLYMLRNACSSQTVCYNGGTCDFRTEKQVCPKGSEVTQLWMLPKYTGACTLTTALTGSAATTNGSATITGTGTSFATELFSGASITVNGQTKVVSYITSSTSLTTTTTFSGTGSGYGITLHDNPYATDTACTGAGGSWSSGSTGSNGAAKWRLVAEYASTGKTNMASNLGDCGSSPNKCLSNSHMSLLEFVGDHIYVGYDNATYGANIWRADMSAIGNGFTPAESDFEMVNIPGLDGSADNEKIFSHISVNESGTDWLILTTRDGTGAVRIYRTANGQD